MAFQFKVLTSLPTIGIDMADVSPFRGIRFDLGHVGSLADVVAPPYDVINAEEQDALYKRHAANVVRLILNRDEPGDDEGSNRYSRAARFLRNWLREGVLFRENEPALYAYHQSYEVAGRSLTRRGFLARVRLEPFGTGQIHPHEETHPRAKQDRLRLWKSCMANLSPIFALYPDEENRAQEILEKEILTTTPTEVADNLGVTHRIWPVVDSEVTNAVTSAMADHPLFIADGHHRYETALALRDEIAAESEGTFGPDHPANYVLMNCVSMSDPGMQVLPTHRLFRSLPPIRSDALAARLAECFTVEVAGPGRLRGYPLWEQIEQEGRQETLALFAAADETWLVARLNNTGKIRLAEIATDRSDAWRSLGVSILHRLVVDSILGAGETATPKYVRSLDELVQGLESGDDVGRDATGQQGTGERFELAALVMPASIDDIRAVCTEGERMPPKSTFFYPKLLSGLVINPLDS